MAGVHRTVRNGSVHGDTVSKKCKPVKSRSDETKIVICANCGKKVEKSGKFSDMQSVIRAQDKPIPKDFRFFVFDCLVPDETRNRTYGDRLFNLQKMIGDARFRNVEAIEQRILYGPVDAKKMYVEAVEAGYEGIMVRSKDAKYKFGRATLREGIIYKFKQFNTADAKIVGFQQATRMKEEVRLGERTRDAMGRLEQSHKQDDYELYESLGAFIVRLDNGLDCKIGLAKGYDQSDRDRFWRERDKLLGKWIEFEFIDVGIKDRPRSGRMVRFRSDKDSE